MQNASPTASTISVSPDIHLLGVAASVLVFRLGADEYGVDLMAVQEIRPYEPPMSVPGAPLHHRGELTLDGITIPIVDLRIRFGYREALYYASTDVIVLKVLAGSIGVIVDSVCDVPVMSQVRVQPAFLESRSTNSKLIVGLIRYSENSLTVIDIEALVCELADSLLCCSLEQMQTEICVDWTNLA